ncbi:MAG TPA: hypothetical protein V6C97_01120, partial [Oculatellaceae cyanobacterium]
ARGCNKKRKQQQRPQRQQQVAKTYHDDAQRTAAVRSCQAMRIMMTVEESRVRVIAAARQP